MPDVARQERTWTSARLRAAVAPRSPLDIDYPVLLTLQPYSKLERWNGLRQSMSKISLPAPQLLSTQADGAYRLPGFHSSRLGRSTHAGRASVLSISRRP